MRRVRLGGRVKPGHDGGEDSRMAQSGSFYRASNGWGFRVKLPDTNHSLFGVLRKSIIFGDYPLRQVDSDQRPPSPVEERQ